MSPVALSVFDLYSVGIGPSSSHTVGPMRAARRFASTLDHRAVGRVRAELFGSLGATGHGHGTARPSSSACSARTRRPSTPDTARRARRQPIRRHRQTRLLGGGATSRSIVDDDIVLHRRKSLPVHPNGMRFHAWTPTGTRLPARTYFSVGGGFVVGEDEPAQPSADTTPVPYPFLTGGELLATVTATGLPISGIMLRQRDASGAPDRRSAPACCGSGRSCRTASTAAAAARACCPAA